jgi:hypothetical protein
MIDRIITPTMMEAAKASPSRLLAFAEIETSSGWVRVHSGHGERTYNSQNYLGLGEFAGISQFKENADSSSNQLTLSLTVLDQSLLSEVMNENLNGKACYIHLVAFDEYRKITEGVDYVVDGEIIDMKIKRGDSTKQLPSIIQLTVADWITRWAISIDTSKTTDSAQQYLYPGDRFFDLVEVIAASPLDSLPVKTFNTATATVQTVRRVR